MCCVDSSSSSSGSSSLPLTTQTSAASATQLNEASENCNVHLPCDTVKVIASSVDTSVDQMNKTGPAVAADDPGKARESFQGRKPFAAGDCVKSQVSSSVSWAFSVTEQKSQLPLPTGQDFTVVDTEISKPSLQSSCANTSSSMGKVQSQLPSTSAVTSSMLHTSSAVKCEPSVDASVMSQTYNAVKCEPSMSATVASTSHVCITSCLKSRMYYAMYYIMSPVTYVLRYVSSHVCITLCL